MVQSQLVRDARQVEILPKWRFRLFDLNVVHLVNQHVPRAIRVFKEFAVQMAPTLFPALPV